MEVGFSFISVKKEGAEMKQEVKTNVTELNGQMDMSLVKIKTEPNCDIAPVHLMHQEVSSFETMLTTIKEEIDSDTTDVSNNKDATVQHLMHQEVSSFETMLTTIKEEIDSDTDVCNSKDVTVHLLIPEAALSENTDVGLQANTKENLLEKNSLVDSDMSSTQSEVIETRDDSFQPNVDSNVVPENSSVPIESTKRPRKKRKIYSEDSDLAILTPQSSTSEEPVKKGRGRKKGSLNKKKKTDVVLDRMFLEKEKAKNKEKIVCPFCDRQMAKGYFTYHIRVHTDERPYKCAKCSYASRFKGPLAFHVASHHPTEGYLKSKK